MKINITREIAPQLFEDLIVTAIEGGSSYWYWLKREEFEKDLPDNNEPLALRIAQALYENRGFKMKVYDCEDDGELLGEISYASCQEAFKIIAERYPHHIDSLLEENWDAETADVFFQLCCFSEVVYC